MSVQVTVLNGGSSSGQTGIARCLQAVLPQPWISALPRSLTDSGSGIAVGQHGEVLVGGGFREIEAAWMAGASSPSACSDRRDRDG